MIKRMLLLTVLLLFASLALGACGAPNTASLGTPIPTIIPATPPGLSLTSFQPLPENICRVPAVDLIGAWVTAGSPETGSFSFTALNGETCQGTFEVDILPLFTQANVWYDGVAACISCHGSDLAVSYAQMDLSSYEGILAGSRRASADVTGSNILGEGEWEKAILFAQFATGRMPPGRPLGMDPKGPVVLAGSR